ncbi:hypothetical protein GQ42DRAFT_178898, partial [Ramicandelaber brevisporus]
MLSSATLKIANPSSVLRRDLLPRLSAKSSSLSLPPSSWRRLFAAASFFMASASDRSVAVPSTTSTSGRLGAADLLLLPLLLDLDGCAGACCCLDFLTAAKAAIIDSSSAYSSPSLSSSSSSPSLPLPPLSLPLSSSLLPPSSLDAASDSSLSSLSLAASSLFGAGAAFVFVFVFVFVCVLVFALSLSFFAEGLATAACFDDVSALSAT